MIIIASKEGQFANRVLHFAHILSFCKANKIRLVHPHFREYLQYFPNLEAEKRVHFPERNFFTRACCRLLILFMRMLLKLRIYNLGFLEIIFYERFDQGAPVYNLSQEFVIRKAKRKILVLWGWLFRDQQNFEREEAYIRQMFSIKETHQRRATELMQSIKQEGITVIGVHIRRGDYKRFENGRWFYEDGVYLEKMKMIEKQFRGREQRVGFVLCSNEDLDLRSFSDLNVFSCKEDFIIDFLLLAEADYIVGPPSTFSALASFYGGKPLQFISERTHQLSLEQFTICQHL